MVELNNTPAFPNDPQAAQSASLLEMAQKVHDDFVETGRSRAEALESEAQKKHDELISSAREFHNITILEAESSAAAIVEDAQLSAFSLISDAKIKADGIVADAHEKTIHLESSILKLQEFEAAYRANLQALVSGAQATLAVAEIAVDDSELPAADFDEETATESETLVTDEPSAEIDDAPSDDLVVSDDDSEADEEEIPESEGDSEEDEPSEETVEESPVIYILDDSVADEAHEPIYYDPLAAESAIDAATIASILDQSGLNNDSSYEPVKTIINANPGAGWSLYSDTDLEDIADDEDVDSDETSSDEDATDSEDSDTDVDNKDKEEK